MAASKKDSPNRSGMPGRRVPRNIWLLIGFAFPTLLLVLSSLQSGPAVTMTLQLTAVSLALWLLGLLYRQRKVGFEYSVSYVPLAPHYVQAIVQICVYVYWGWYWRPVYDHAGLIIAQLLLVYSLDMLLSLTRRRQWTLGFGPFPIILSTNLFLLFKPEWFYLQFVLVAVGILGKEFIRWNRDGRDTHIFNPSALSLFVFSIVLIVTDTTHWSFAQEIAITLNQPPHIYLQIFLLGLVVQGLFSVTLVTLMSALALIGLNVAYTGFTGTYFFLDSNIPIAVFLGLHLLITDPATSPRTAVGKAMFGILYGSGVFLLYGLLGWLGAPTFYDKLLCVPLLNLLVPWIDALARRLRPAVSAGRRTYSEISANANYKHMFAWIVVFSIMLGTTFVGRGHPGGKVEFWEDACDRNLRNGCLSLYRVTNNNCNDGNATDCMRAAELARSNPVVADQLELGKILSRACDFGHMAACEEFREYVQNGGKALLDDACDKYDYESCFISGLAAFLGVGTPIDPPAGISNWEKACEARWAMACGFLGQAYLAGRNIDADAEVSAGYLDRACTLGYKVSCTTLGQMYRRGHGVVRDEDRAEDLFQTACASGIQPACENLQRD